MDQCIEAFLADVLAGKTWTRPGRGCGSPSPAARRSSGCGSLTIGEHLKLVLSVIDRQVC